jgi:hypothetical protein
MEEVTIVVDMPKNLECFVRTIFNTPTGSIKLTRKHAIGLSLNSLVRFTQAKPKQKTQSNPVAFVLPKSNLLDFDYRYIYLPAHNERQFIDFVKSYYFITIDIYFVEGTARGYKQNLIVESFIQHYGLGRDAITFDAVKKSGYRKRVKIQKEIAAIGEHAVKQRFKI